MCLPVCNPATVTVTITVTLTITQLWEVEFNPKQGTKSRARLSSLKLIYAIYVFSSTIPPFITPSKSHSISSHHLLLDLEPVCRGQK